MASFMDESSFLHSGAVIMVEGCKKYGWTWKIRDGNTRGAKSALILGTGIKSVVLLGP